MASTPDGSIVWGNRRRYELNIRISADSLLRIEREFAPLRVPGAEREQWLARIRYVKRQSPNSLDAAWVVSEEKPSFKALSVGDDGRIWVQRFVEGDDGPPATQSQTDQPPRVTWREKPTFDVFEGDGTFLGTVELPYGSRMFVRRGEYLWGIVPGELGESYIVRYRMEV